MIVAPKNGGHERVNNGMSLVFVAPPSGDVCVRATHSAHRSQRPQCAPCATDIAAPCVVQVSVLSPSDFKRMAFVAEDIDGNKCLPANTGRFQPPPSPPSPPSPPPSPPPLVECGVDGFMLRSLRWGGTDEQHFGTTGGKYVHTFSGGGGSQDFQMPNESPLVFWEGRAEFERHALDIDLHPTIGVTRGPGDETTVEQTFLLRHHRFPNMYIHPLACSDTVGSLTCQDTRAPLIPPPVGTRLVYQNGVRDADADAARDKFDELGFQFILNPYAPEPHTHNAHAPVCIQCSGHHAHATARCVAQVRGVLGRVEQRHGHGDQLLDQRHVLRAADEELPARGHAREWRRHAGRERSHVASHVVRAQAPRASSAQRAPLRSLHTARASCRWRMA